VESPILALNLGEGGRKLASKVDGSENAFKSFGRERRGSGKAVCSNREGELALGGKARREVCGGGCLQKGEDLGKGIFRRGSKWMGSCIIRRGKKFSLWGVWGHREGCVLKADEDVPRIGVKVICTHGGRNFRDINLGKR